MSSFNPQTITKKGEELIARALAEGGTIHWTRVALGDGSPGGNAAELEELISPKLDAILINNNNLGEVAELIAKFSNENIVEEFDIKELGIFGEIEGDTESILYSYSTANDYSRIPTNTNPFEMEWSIYTQVTNGDKIDILINPTLQMLNKETADGLYEKIFVKNTAFNMEKATDYTSFSEEELPSMAVINALMVFLKQYSDANTAGIIDAAPATLDTLNELARALGEDPDFATTVTNLIATKLGATAQAVDSAKLGGATKDAGNSANSIVQRDGAGNIKVNTGLAFGNDDSLTYNDATNNFSLNADGSSSNAGLQLAKIILGGYEITVV